MDVSLDIRRDARGVGVTRVHGRGRGGVTGPRRPRYVETQERKISGTKGRGRRRGLRDTHHSMANTVAWKNGKKRVSEGVRRPARAARVYSAVTASLPRALQKVVEEDKNMNSAYQRTDFDYEADFAPDFGM